MKSTHIVAAFSVLSLLAFATSGRAQTATTTTSSTGALGVTLDEVFSAWEARAAEIRSFEAVWDQQELIRRGALHTTAVSKDGKPSVAPERDTTIGAVCEVRLQNDQAFTRRQGTQWDSELDAFVDRTQAALLERSQFTVLSHVGQNRAEPRATVLPTERYRDPRSVANIPMFLAIRARDKALAPVGQDGVWSIAPITAEAGGRSCIVLERTLASYRAELAHGELHETYWVDPASEFCVRRFERSQGGTVELQIEIDYDNAAHAWLPTAWKSMIYGGSDAMAMRQYDAQLKTFAVNGAATAKRMQIEFPVGTAVNNVVSGEAWIALANGERRMVTAEERARGATYAQLVASEPGRAGLPAWRPWRTLAAATAMLLAVGVVASRWRVRRTSNALLPVVASSGNSSRWVALLALGASLALASFAATDTVASPNVCGGRCHAGVWSAYRQGFSYRMDFILNCKYRAWSNNHLIPYSSANGCTGGFVTVPYWLVYSVKPSACNGFTPVGDLMHTTNLDGTAADFLEFQCCNPTGTCYGM
jgi:hypothetical protein